MIDIRWLTRANQPMVYGEKALRSDDGTIFTLQYRRVIAGGNLSPWMEVPIVAEIVIEEPEDETSPTNRG